MRSEEMVGQILGHYRIKRPLGYGGTATVFLADDIHLQRQVALKLFQAREGEKADFLRRFAREARVLAQLDHPHILPVYDYGEQNEQAYLIIPYMPGGSLRDLLQKHHIISSQETILLIGQVLQGLQYAHEQGLIHRDIKPGNMLFKADGTLMLSDFGLVKVMTGPDSPASRMVFQDNDSVTTQAITGTPDYMAPEQILGQVTQSSDIYAIGVVLYEMLTGSRPFSSDNYMGILMKHVHEQPQPLHIRNASIAPALEAVVLRAMEKDTTKRYQRPRDLYQALQLAMQITDKDEGLRLAEPTLTSQWPFPISPGSTPPPQPISNAPSTPAPQSNDTLPTIPVGNGLAMTPQEMGPIEQQLGRQNTPPPISPLQTQPAQRRSPIVAILISIILVLLISLGGVLYINGIFLPHNPGAVIASPTPKNSTPNAINSGLALTNATTTCPTSGSARAAITPPITTGNHPNVIYIVNEYAGTTPTFGTLKRRDTTTTAKGIEIVKMANLSISEAELSQDEQWIIFTVLLNGQNQIRLVRIDGKGLQTLYCAPDKATISNTQLSYDQKRAVFTLNAGTPNIDLLDLTSGNLQTALIGSTKLGYAAKFWLDNQRVYVTGFVPNADAPSQDISILDTSKGPSQNDTQLQRVVSGSSLCESFDSSYDNNQLLIANCTSQGLGPQAAIGPSTITSQPATGGPTSQIYSSPTWAISMIRAVTQIKLLLLVENTSGDQSQNGLWTMNMDGSNPMRLTTDANNEQSLCPFSQYSWSNVSADGSLYALQSFNPASHSYGIGYGSLNGGNFTQFAGISDGTQLYLVGWANI
jgi:eukaryotic-like serine/threonine-protein kinase